MNDNFRNYVGYTYTNFLIHYGVAHDKNPPGRGSGRWPWSGGKKKKITLKEEIDKAANRSKEDILKDPTAHEVNKIRSELTNEQLQKVLDRIDLNVKLEKALKAELNAGNKKEKSVFDTIDGLMNKVGKVNTWAEKGIKSYDLINQIIQIFNGVDMDKIKRMK